MFDWLKNINKEHPPFWKNYLESFANKTQRYVVFSCESSGHNITKDVLFSVGGIGIIDEMIVVKDGFEVVMLQYRYLHDNGLSNDFILVSKIEKMTEYDGLKSFIEYISNAVLVGHRTQYDIDMINEALEQRMDCGRLRNEALDIEIMFNKVKDTYEKKYSLQEMCDYFQIPISERNSAMDDAYTIGLLFIKLKNKLGI